MTSHATHYLDTQDLGPDTLRRQMQLVRLLKDADRRRACPELLRDASLGMIFEEASTRTRVSFEVAMTKLGGHALYLKPGEIHLGQKENIADTARVLSRMVDAVEIRAFHHETVTSFAKYATVPVINGLTDYNHPTQALCDVFTMGEHKLPDKSFADLTVVFIGDATNVCTSTAMIVTMLGGTFIHARPEAYSHRAAVAAGDRRGQAERGAATADGTARPTEVEDAVRDADFVYTDLWWWFGQEDEIPDRTAAFMPRYQVTPELLARAPDHVKFMHCLPASRGVEVTDEVMDGPRVDHLRPVGEPAPHREGPAGLVRLPAHRNGRRQRSRPTTKPRCRTTSPRCRRRSAPRDDLEGGHDVNHNRWRHTSAKAKASGALRRFDMILVQRRGDHAAHPGADHRQGGSGRPVLDRGAPRLLLRSLRPDDRRARVDLRRHRWHLLVGAAGLRWLLGHAGVLVVLDQRRASGCRRST